MNNHRFKLSFNDLGYVKPANNDIHNLINKLNIAKPLQVITQQQVIKQPHINNAQLPVVNAHRIIQGSTLNMPMINRVHKAKPGCSACGKKVA